MNTYSSNKFLKKINKPLFLCLLDILNKNNIKYFGSSGTLLGAIRHQGIIPWDTDIDIGMFYQDLQQLFDCLEGTSFFIWGIPDYTFFTNNVSKNYNDFYSHPKYRADFENRIKSVEELKKFLGRNTYIISSNNVDNKPYGKNKTCCELEILKFCSKNIYKYWADKLTKLEFNKGIYCYLIKSWETDNEGMFNYPKSYMEEYIYVPFYNKHIRIPKIYTTDPKYCEDRFGKNCMIKYPKIDNKQLTGSQLIEDFSPL